MTERLVFNDLLRLGDLAYAEDMKISCIKMLRTITGGGLKETKEFFEDEWLPLLRGTKNPPNREPYRQQNDDTDTRLKVLEEKVQILTAAQIKSTAASLLQDGD